MSKIPLDSEDLTNDYVAPEIPCRKCGYNLRGLSFEGRCPECSTSVAVSLNGDLLCHSDPEFVRTLRRGVGLIVWGFVPALVAWIIVTVFARGPRDTPPLQLLILLTGLPGTLGTWFLTTPDPSGIGEDRYGTARKISRITLVGEMIVQLIRLIARIGHGGSAPWTLFTALVFIVNIIKLAEIVALLVYLKKLTMRIPDLSLTRVANTLMWCYGVTYTVNIIFGVIVVWFIYVLKTPISRFYYTNDFRSVFAVIVLVLALFYLSMVIRFGRHFKRQAALAEGFWAVASSPHVFSGD